MRSEQAFLDLREEVTVLKDSHQSELEEQKSIVSSLQDQLVALKSSLEVGFIGIHLYNVLLILVVSDSNGSART